MDQHNNTSEPGTGGFAVSMFCSILGWADIQPALASTASIVAIISGIYSIYKTNKKSNK